MARILPLHDYTVGWVCALPIELTAAQLMLDEEHQDLPRDFEDANIYTLGRIGEHNVVLACLPAGQTGTNTAATVALQIKSTFPSIRFGLMVGIGGGVPSSEADIRLGDIVVSQPGKGHGGVVQYDFGKSTPGGFERTGFLNAPPRILLSAVSKLRANRDRDRGDFVRHMSKLNELPKFVRNKAGGDTLFEGGHIHVGSHDCTSCDSTRTIQRQERRDLTPEVHYGLIASGNQVIRDGTTRDQISSELGGVLCFEMEAAGLLDSFPCLVIRGICDYADSHKNKRWQPYAAGTAAAYSKELLLVIPAGVTTKGQTTEETTAAYATSNSNRYLDRSSFSSLSRLRRRESSESLDSSRTKVATEDDLRDKILQWLSPVDCAHDLAREGRRRAPGTSEWLFKLEFFCNWYESLSPSILWISGPPGSGKTVLGANIIHNLQQRSSSIKPLLYFLGDKSDNQKRSFHSVCATLLGQVMAQIDVVPSDLVRALEASRRYGRSQFAEADGPETLLMKIVGHMPSTDIVLDGLDEFHDIGRMLSLMKKLTLCNHKNHVIVLSRDYPKIAHALASALHIDLLKSPLGGDIDSYIRQSIDASLIENGKMRKTIVRNLSDAAENSFLWASLVLEDVVNATSVSHIKQIMANLPRGLEAAYAEIFHRLSLKGAHSLRLSQATFLWLCCSWRYLSWAELQCALANAISGEPHSADHLPFKSAVLEACGSLVRYEAEQDIVRPVHLSVREYVMNGTLRGPTDLSCRFREPDAHAELAKQCLEYLQKIQLPVGKWECAELPMLSYATQFWCRHTISSTYDTKLHRAVVSFLSDLNKRASWLMNMVFYGAEIFPIRVLIRMQAQLSEWLNQSGIDLNVKSEDAEQDWTIDIMKLLLHTNPRNEGSYFVKAMHMRDLARSLTLNGLLSKAVANVEIELSKQDESRENSKKTWLLNFLGVLYDQQGDAERSLETQRQAFEIQKPTFGAAHPESVWTVNEMGRILRHLGRFEESEAMHQTALRTLSKTNGNDMEIAWTQSTLSRTYRKQGRFREALDLAWAAFETNANMYGEDHPQCLWILNDIGQCYRFLAKYEEAERVFRQAWEKRAIVLGAEHSDTLWSANNLGILLAEMRRQEEAMDLQRATFEIQERVLGLEHRFTVWTKDVIEKLA